MLLRLCPPCSAQAWLPLPQAPPPSAWHCPQLCGAPPPPPPAPSSLSSRAASKLHTELTFPDASPFLSGRRTHHSLLSLRLRRGSHPTPALLHLPVANLSATRPMSFPRRGPPGHQAPADRSSRSRGPVPAPKGGVLGVRAPAERLGRSGHLPRQEGRAGRTLLTAASEPGAASCLRAGRAVPTAGSSPSQHRGSRPARQRVPPETPHRARPVGTELCLTHSFPPGQGSSKT